MRTCCVVTDAETAQGFLLAGVEAAVAEDPQAAEDLLASVVEGGECGLLLVSERLLDGVSDSLLRKVERAGLPLVVPLPLETGWRGEERSLEYLLRLIRRSIGYHMRIRR